MLNTHFDLQNIITEMESSAQASETRIDGGSGDFSATMKRVAEGGSSPTAELAAASSEEETLAEQPATEEDAEITGEPQSGNVLPLLPLRPATLNQMTLESKRPILVGSSKLSLTAKRISPELTLLPGAGNGRNPDGEMLTLGGNRADSTEAQRFAGKLSESLDSVRVLRETSGSANHAERSDALLQKIGQTLNGQILNRKSSETTLTSEQSDTGIHSLSRNFEARAGESGTLPKPAVSAVDTSLDVEAMQQGLSKLIKNQIVSSITGKNVSVKMVLTPESLGEIQVDLTFGKDRDLQVTLRPETAEVAKLIQTHSASLREQLAAEHKGQFALNVSDDTDQNPASGNHQHQGRGMTASSPQAGQTEQTHAEPGTSVSDTGSASNSLIDTFA